jgi:glycosyltransferase involved in cell wall biosynthesis
MIADSDLLLRTTLHDGDSVAVREALHLGTPVIATDNGMRPVGVDLIPVSDTAALHRAVEDGLERTAPHECRDAAGTENLQAILQNYEALTAELGHRPRPRGAFSTLLDSRRE